MKVRLKEQNDGSIHVSKMKDGDMAVIMPSWGSYEGTIVQRCDKSLVRLGYSKSEGWPSAFMLGRIYQITETSSPQCRVRLLKPGDVLVIE